MSLSITKAFCMISLIFIIHGCTPPQFNEKEWRNKVESTQVSLLYEKHYKDGVFFNPWLRSDRGFSDFLKWKFTSSATYTDKEETYLPVVRSDAKAQIQENLTTDFILWIGHNSYLIKTGTQVWLLDPIFSNRAMLPARVTPPALTVEDVNELFPEVNVIISHNHYDHLDANSIEALSSKYIFYVPLGLKNVLQDWQPHAKIVEMDWWDKVKISDDFELHALPAQHWSKRVTAGRDETLWASFMIITPKTILYFGGDSGYFIGYRVFGRQYPTIDYALLPITAYHPRWFMHEAHMNVEEAILAFQDLNAKYFIPTQWGTFHLGEEPPGYPGLDLKKHISQNRLDENKFLILDIGELKYLELSQDYGNL
jgi:L-ascorbate metabolism protein UlaG (beta-lactamase superfamily)